ncbi:hypothetical protein [Streptomyces sp900116325]|uniref:hypothetical protein n=1 Tax=Streptomyces sp. 900116325 TaxID=3154295 RepID=UPI0033B884C0
MEGELAEGESVKLMRLRYHGTANRWAFALYDAGSDRYQDTLLPTGSGSGTPEDALDCACDSTSPPPASDVAASRWRDHWPPAVTER